MAIVTRLLTQKNNSNSNDFNNLASPLHQMECGTTLEIFAAQREVRLVEQRLLKIINMSASYINCGLLHREGDVVLLGNAAHVEDSITHTSQGRIDTHAGGIGDFLKAHVLVVAHHQNFTLAFGQCFDQALDIVMYLGGDDVILDGACSKFLAVEDVHLTVIG